jgi:excisionase family DNA binding protein
MTNDEMLTVDAVARRLSVRPEAVRSWLRERRLRGVRLGGTKLGWRVSPAEVERFVNEAMAADRGEQAQSAG